MSIIKPKFNLPHFDAAENVFFQRELEQILAEQFDVKYAGLKARQLLPVDNSIDPGAETVAYESFDQLGAAARITDYSDDLPMVNVKGSQTSQRMQSYGAAFGYSIGEIRAAAKAGKPLERMRAMAARKVLDLKLDDVAATGDSTAGLSGLLSLSNTETFTVSTKAGGGQTWAVATADEILADMNGMIRQVVVNSKEVERPTRLILPTTQFEQISSKARSTTSDTTVLSFFLANHPGVEVMSWERLAGAGALGVDRMVAYDPNILNIRLLMAVEFEQLAPQQRNMSYVVNCHMRTGGVISPYPKSVIYGDGI